MFGLPRPSLGREAPDCRETFQMLVLAATDLSAGCGLGAHCQARSGWREDGGDEAATSAPDVSLALGAWKGWDFVFDPREAEAVEEVEA